MYGFEGHIGIANEASWGTAVGATDYMEAMSESLQETIERFPTRNIISRFSEPDDMGGLKQVAGDLVIAANPISVGWLLKGATGVQSNSAVLSGFLHTHEFTFGTSDTGANNPLDPFTLEVYRGVTSAQQITGVQMGRLQLALSPNAPLMATASIIGKAVTDIAKTTASFPGSPVDPFAFDTASLQLAGAASAFVEGFTLELDHGLQGVPSLNNSRTIAKVRRQNVAIARVSGTLAFENNIDLNRFRDETEIALKVNMTRANSFSMLIDIPRMIYSTFPLSMQGRDRLLVGFNGMARYHTGSAQSFKVTLTNTQSGY